MSFDRKFAVLSGGVGGARLVDGLRQVASADQFTTIVNTGDDLSMWGLRICPDLDTVLYTLSGKAPRKRGWGIEDDTFHTLERMRELGEPGWFALGDQDIGTHLVRTRLLGDGMSLTDVTKQLFERHEVNASVVPMSDQPSPTRIRSNGDVLDFQEWLVKGRGKLPAHEVILPEPSAPSPEALSALREANVVFITPSNPYVSIDPILHCKGVRDALKSVPVIGVSPIIGKQAVKGPLANMLAKLGRGDVSAGAVAHHYEELLDGYAVATGDADSVDGSVQTLQTDILIIDDEDRRRLAAELLEFAASFI
jgi:LPPG:FO 2-phospho-L-lactate transferase